MDRKVWMNLPDAVLRDLAATARSRHTTMTDAAKQALFLHRYLVQQVSKGSKILVEKENRQVMELVLLDR